MDKKIVLKLNIHDNKDKQRVIRAVSSLTGIDLLEVDVKGSKMTIVGEVDPVDVVSKLKKQWDPEIITVGPAKEEKKEDKKEEKKNVENAQMVHFGRVWQDFNHPPYYHYPPNSYPHYDPRFIEEDPNACVIS